MAVTKEYERMYAQILYDSTVLTEKEYKEYKKGKKYFPDEITTDAKLECWAKQRIDDVLERNCRMDLVKTRIKAANTKSVLNN